MFPPHATNEDLYESLASPIVEAALSGFNATVFAYGQTSSGKTHTMLGHPDDLGITPRAISHVLRFMTSSKTRRYLIRASYVEIYNDKIRDLINPQSADLHIREDKAGRVFVDAEEVIVESLTDAMTVLERGQTARHVGETKMNSRSSRSHTVFTLHIESKGGGNDPNAVAQDQSFRASSLNLVDLAGSERLKSTGAEGTRQKEGAHINKSLLVLGTIINRLSSARSDVANIGHLPYRDSKLTRLLRPALGGNAKTAIMCAITPSGAHIEETISTLKFAERAKKITNRAVRNEIVDYRTKYKETATELAILRQRCCAMEAELANGRSEGGLERASNDSSSCTDVSTSTVSQLDVPDVRMTSGVTSANVISMSVELQASREEVVYLKEHVDEVETENEHLRVQLRKKGAEFRSLRSRALELRSATRKAKGNERALRRALAVSFKKLEEAREQLDISRKKGSHVRVAEIHLAELSESLRSWLPANGGLDELVSIESLSPPLSEVQEDGAEKSAMENGMVDTRVVALYDPRNRRIGVAGGGNTEMRGGASVRKAVRKPRLLPEDMVADIDDSDVETDLEHITVEGLDNDDDEDDVMDLAEFSSPRADVRMRTSDDRSAEKKAKKKPSGWKAFKSFYGYGYTERSVYDKMIAGHKVPSTSSHISS